MACGRRESAGNERQSQVKVDSLAAMSYHHGPRKAGDNHTRTLTKLGRRRVLPTEKSGQIKSYKWTSSAQQQPQSHLECKTDLNWPKWDASCTDWLTEWLVNTTPKGNPVRIRIRIRIQSSVKRLFTRFQSLFQQLVRLSYLWPTNLVGFTLVWAYFHLV